jgi:hypothetical protein
LKVKEGQPNMCIPGDIVIVIIDQGGMKRVGIAEDRDNKYGKDT